jgi:hypothetical protein
MAAEEAKTPDQWEAAEIIDGLRPLRNHSVPDPSICNAHTNALIWIVRRLDVAKPDPWLYLAKASPWTVLFILVGWLAWLFKK